MARLGRQVVTLISILDANRTTALDARHRDGKPYHGLTIFELDDIAMSDSGCQDNIVDVSFGVVLSSRSPSGDNKLDGVKTIALDVTPEYDEGSAEAPSRGHELLELIIIWTCNLANPGITYPDIKRIVVPDSAGNLCHANSTCNRYRTMRP